MERARGLRRIQTYEEYSEAKVRLMDYLKQYKWIMESKNPYKDISEQLVSCIEVRKKYESKETEKDEQSAENKDVELENERRIVSLKSRYESIKTGNYKETLYGNITALYIAIADFEARIEKRGRRIFKKKAQEGKEDVPQDMLTSPSMRRFRFWMAQVIGDIPGEVVLAEKADPEYFLDNYLLQIAEEAKAIEPEEKSEISNETSLVAVKRENGFCDRFIAPYVNAFITSQGVTVTSNSEAAKTDKESDEAGAIEKRKVAKESLHKPQVSTHDAAGKDEKGSAHQKGGTMEKEE